ncbi:MAG: F0F1 ATP synthase subunit delta [Methylovirgula sp.]
MHIDWSTLALQTINVLILVWILAKFLFRPVRDIIAKRQAQADAVLADATALKQQAAESKAAADHARAEIDAQRQQLLTEAQKEAATEKARLLEAAGNEVTRMKAAAATAAARERSEMEEALLARIKALVIDITRRLLTRIPPDAGLDGFVDGLCEKTKTLPPETFAALCSGDDGSAVEVVTATALTPEATARLRKKLQAVLGANVTLQFSIDPAVLAGIELHGATVSLNNSLHQDLDRIVKDLSLGA